MVSRSLNSKFSNACGPGLTLNAMKTILLPLLLLLAPFLPAKAELPSTESESLPEKADFDRCFADSTLRLDLVFGGTSSNPSVSLRRLSKSYGWAGRRFRLDQAPLAGNGSVVVRDPVSGDTLYLNTFSSLFQEWLPLPEAQSVSRAFQNTFLVPLPLREAEITVELRDNRLQPIASSTFPYSPSDELVALSDRKPLPHRHLHRGGDPARAIDVAILAEGYRPEEMDSFLFHAERMTREILSYEPFASARDRFNFVAVLSPSEESGVSVPKEGDWRQTAFGSHFSTFHMDRYLTPPEMWAVHDALAGIPYEHVLILVNTDRYGGGGIFNNVQIASASNRFTLPVTVHEFGHSFGGLADEYFYADQEGDTYPLDVEPWEPNLTTLTDFNSKWADMLDPTTPVPTPWEGAAGTRDQQQKANDKANDKASKRVSNQENEYNQPAIGVYEGGGYRTHGLYRPAVSCRMRDNHNPAFCPVCTRALQRVIDFYTLP